MEEEKKVTSRPVHSVSFGKDSFVAFAFGNRFNVFNKSNNELKKCESSDLKEKQHADIVRHLQFNSDGTRLSTSSDDKTLKIWNTNDWTVVSERKTPKKISHILFVDGKTVGSEANGDVIVYSDKFGDVFWSPVDDLSQQTLLLGHCSTVTSMLLSTSKDFVLTSDREHKIRVSHFPKAYIIEQFCLGHTSVITKFLIPEDSIDHLISTGGDGTLRVWDYKKGKQLQNISIEGEITPKTIVSGLAYCPISHKLAVVVEGSPKVLIYDFVNNELKYANSIELENSSFPLSANFSQELLWVNGSNPSVCVFQFDSKSNAFVKSSMNIDIVLNSVESGDKSLDQLLQEVSLNQLRKKTEDENYVARGKRQKKQDE